MFRAIQLAVTSARGAEDFSGVTVQPMIRRDGYELILGSTVDPQFGPVILFGSGGVMAEVYRDYAIGLPPLNTTLAQRLIEQTHIYTALTGVRGRKAVNLAKLQKVLVCFSQLVLDQPWIKEIDINPLQASEDQLIALDARVIVHDASMTADLLPRSAIRPYPSQYFWQTHLKDGTAVTIRPIRPEDEPLIAQFHTTLSERSVYLRYFCSLSLTARVEHERLARICFAGYDRGFALVAEKKNPETGSSEILGVARFSAINSAEAEAAVLVSDQWQGRRPGNGTDGWSQPRCKSGEVPAPLGRNLARQSRYPGNFQEDRISIAFDCRSDFDLGRDGFVAKAAPSHPYREGHFLAAEDPRSSPTLPHYTVGAGCEISNCGSNLRFVPRARETRHSFSARFRSSRARSRSSAVSIFKLGRTTIWVKL